MYDELNLLERILLEDVLEVEVGCCSGVGVDLGVSGGVSNLMGVRGRLIFRVLTAVLRVDLLNFASAAPWALMWDFLDFPAWCPLFWYDPAGIPEDMETTKDQVTGWENGFEKPGPGAREMGGDRNIRCPQITIRMACFSEKLRNYSNEKEAGSSSIKKDKYIEISNWFV